MKDRRSPLSIGWLLWVFLGALIGAVVGQLIELQLTGASETGRTSLGGVLGGVAGALLGNVVGSRLRRRRMKKR